jgi:hypothetical protein
MNRVSSKLLQRRKYYNPLIEISEFRLRPMHLRFSSFASVLATSSAWIPAADNLLSSRTCQLSSLTFPPSRTYSDFSLKSTVADEEVNTPALIPQGKPVADGHVVSSFKGGFIAVRVDDDIADILANPEVVDTTKKLLPKESKSSSLGESLKIVHSDSDKSDVLAL